MPNARIDPMGANRIVDLGGNSTLSNGIEAPATEDFLENRCNGARREVILRGANEGESGTDLPLMLGMHRPHFRGGSYSHFDDCFRYLAADWTVTTATSGTATPTLGNFGELVLAAGAATADQGINIQHIASIPALAANQVVTFGARIKVSVGTTNFGQMFCGLSDTETAIVSGGVQNSSDFIGFMVDAAGSAAGTVDFQMNSTSGSLEQTASVDTMVKATYIDFEMVIDGVTTATPYLDGVAGTAITISDPPEGVMRPSFVCQAEGTDSVTATLDWFYVTTTNR